ncbi:MAG TPA: Wadjet anti-phage system protein JetD domain-containing protein, partial [Opitutus sp.]|nr:Wadjet anti-phage system protein JetD domain-containing protein [Opitutus sp.]
EVASFRRDAAWVLTRFPAAQSVLLQSPRLVQAHTGAWEGIAEVVDYLRTHPRPNCYMRALPVSVPTKFIERHRSALEALLSVHPDAEYRPEGISFEARSGFAEDDASIRGRFLCPVLRRTCGFAADDVELRVGTWATLELPADVRIVACENKTNFLALPPMAGTLALWGAGGAATGHFPRIPWLGTSRFVYWGDLDPSGFAILASLRATFPNVRSALMDAATLAAHRPALALAKPPRHPVRTQHLTAEESAAIAGILQPPRGIEQEKLLFREGLQAIVTAF